MTVRAVDLKYAVQLPVMLLYRRIWAHQMYQWSVSYVFVIGKAAVLREQCNCQYHQQWHKLTAFFINTLQLPALFPSKALTQGKRGNRWFTGLGIKRLHIQILVFQAASFSPLLLRPRLTGSSSSSKTKKMYAVSGMGFCPPLPPFPKAQGRSGGAGRSGSGELGDVGYGRRADA